MITIVDYGLGNIRAFINTYKQLGLPITVARNAQELKQASKIILPGVGAFDLAMTLFQQSGMREVADELVQEKDVPVLGICVGMQIMASSSDEGQLPGLNWIPGRVRKFNRAVLGASLPLPHMGWNNVSALDQHGLFNGLSHAASFYFLHSFYYECEDGAHVLAQSQYGQEFSCAVRRGSVHGVQFHPEKSHSAGTRLLKNFAEL
ncbi:MAG: imidazole glycerol phosphate synthase subunit HisH [Alcaligenes nematophilus]|uniref:imidazole glycerol phosphate synthase subunit HisH n=1 Tax=Alcaligenes nematophilus TaxID=2994643 RepID=UPI0007573939|nr:imidazole glycerol phosphate synthase subunit HisH [Alcaligenes faecalis]KVX04951.1 imidazole glycerol phosphate synthase subunit HisH [Alcaligenes faecalis]